MLRKIHLHGRLKKKFGACHELAVDTVGEAVRGLSQITGFLDELKKGSYELVRGDRKTGFRIDLEGVNTFNLGSGELHIVPITAGAKSSGSGGALKAVLGVALIGMAIFFSGGTLAAPLAGLMTAGGGLTFAGNVAIMGLGLVLAGVSQMLTPNQEAKDKQESSFALGPTNTSGQGAPVPLIFGEVMTGSLLASAGMDVETIKVGWDPLKGDTTVFGGDP